MSPGYQQQNRHTDRKTLILSPSSAPTIYLPVVPNLPASSSSSLGLQGAFSWIKVSFWLGSFSTVTSTICWLINVILWWGPPQPAVTQCWWSQDWAVSPVMHHSSTYLSLSSSPRGMFYSQNYCQANWFKKNHVLNCWHTVKFCCFNFGLRQKIIIMKSKATSNTYLVTAVNNLIYSGLPVIQHLTFPTALLIAISSLKNWLLKYVFSL